jgi:ribonuclease P protein component
LLERLKTRPEFLRVARARRKWVAPGLILQVALRERDAARSTAPISEARFAEARFAEDGDGGCRIGFTASRKVGGAVTRNRARRRLRAATEIVMPAHAKGGRDYVVIARSTTAKRPFGALVEDLETALRKIGAYRDASSPGADAGGRRNGA